MFKPSISKIVIPVIVILQLAFLMPLQPVFAVANSADKTEVKDTTAVDTRVDATYSSLMRELTKFKKSGEEKSDSLSSDMDSFLKSEKERLNDLDVGFFKKRNYLNFLEDQIDKTKGKKEGLIDRAVNKIKDLLNWGDEEDVVDLIKIPQKPAKFKFNDADPKINKLQFKQAKEGDMKISTANLSSFAFIPIANALDAQYMPSLDDVKEDEGEVEINLEISDLASTLNNNPVEITNYVRQNIVFEPYYGAKKGSVGCLKEKVCNDVDASSLLIALMRSAGIPARYRKSVAVIDTDTLKNILGVDHNNAVYYAFAGNKVPIHLISGTTYNSDQLSQVDLSSETSFALEWTHVQIFYDYDEQGGNINNPINFSTATNTTDLRTSLADYPKKQWLSLDGVIKKYTRIKNEIVHDTVNFNTPSFWNGFLQYQGTLDPMEKYVADINTASGKNVSSSAYQSYSYISSTSVTYQILPPSLPYQIGSGVSGTTTIAIEKWSQLPNTRRHQVKLSLKDGSNNTILSQTFYASNISNQEIDLTYEGYSSIDKSIIESYGGIHATPANLVDIVPVFQFGGVTVSGTTKISIGDSLVLDFDALLNNQSLYSDQKFSVAGNREGIFLSFSRIQEDYALDTDARILLRGNVGIARKYLLEFQKESDFLSKVLDMGVNYNFTRAVVTQNRVLSKVSGTPTTFDFGGLTVDAASYITDYSKRNNYNYSDHREDFHLLTGLQNSDYEGEIFTEVAGLEGISTVSGLQYAYQSATYTVHSINTSTANYQNLINGLTLSVNTKANILADVNAGKTVITPDKVVEKGNWKGVLYISLDSDGTATYAIGEQVSNGGWTVGQMIQKVYLDKDNKQRTAFLLNFGNSKYFFEDGKKMDSLSCKITNAEEALIRLTSGWKDSYGLPCMIDTVRFGEKNSYNGYYDHSYILASNGAHFYSQGKYDYWDYRVNIVSKIDQYISDKKNLSSSNLNYLDSGKKYNFKFSPVVGTYLQSICEASVAYKCVDYATIYYVPANSAGNVYRVRGFSLQKLDINNDSIIKKVGYPLSDENYAGTSKEVKGSANNRYRTYQNFANGQLYQYIIGGWEVGLPYVFYTFGQITYVHDVQNSGTNGILGFPKKDPKIKNGLVYQLFEDGQEIEWNLSSGTAASIKYKKYRCETSSNINNSYLLRLIQIQGILDTGIKTVEDIAGMIGSGLSSMAHPVQTAGSLKDLIDEIGDINYDMAVDFLKETKNSAYDWILDEYTTSHGSQGCKARAAYVDGVISGEVLLIVVPIAKIKLVLKARALKYAQKTSLGMKAAGSIVKWLKYRDGVISKLENLVVPGKFKKGHIQETLLGRFNTQTNKFQGEGFHSARTLKNYMENSPDIEVWDIDKKIKYSKYSDIPKVNGVPEVVIKKTTGFSPKKSMFPENWTDEDIVDAIVEASANRIAGTNEFISSITKNGVTLKVRGFFESQTSQYIKHGFPDMTN